ncbi:MAG: flagellar biosynthetic protein FliQ [Bdellovibrionales bacterium]|nr:flagellar biosynthetic protein FliQ [Bdellovibrionales bacterium]
MDFSIVGNALALTAQTALVLAAVAAGAAFVVGLFQAATQITDDSISFVAKLSAITLALYVVGSTFAGQIEDFARSVWNGKEYFY